MLTKLSIAVGDVPARALEAVVAAERSRARTVIVRDNQPIAAIVPVQDLERIDPPDPGATGRDRMLELCAACHHDGFLELLETIRSEG